MAYKVVGKLNGKIIAETTRETMREVEAIKKAYDFFSSEAEKFTVEYQEIPE